METLGQPSYLESQITSDVIMLVPANNGIIDQSVWHYGIVLALSRCELVEVKRIG